MKELETPPFPDVLRVEPSGSCNLKCIHCPTGLGIGEQGWVMKEDVFRIVLNEIKNNSYRVVVLYHGGEPLLNKNIYKWIEEVKSLGVEKVKIVSNGILLNKIKSRKLIESGLDEIEISLDGNSAQENDFIRKGSSFNKVICSIKELATLKEKYRSRTPLIYISNVQFIDSSIRKIPTGDLLIPKYFIKSLGKSIFDKVIIKPQYGYLWPGLNSEKMDHFELIDEKMFESENMEKNICKTSNETITVRYNGDVVACCYDITSEYVLGNIKEKTLQKIWESEKYNLLRKSIKDRKYLRLCSECVVVKPQKLLTIKKTISNRG